MIEGQEGVTWEQWVALARACDEHGVEALFRSDHYLSLAEPGEQRGSLDCWATLSALAAVTSKVRLGSLVSPATFRHPSVLAKSAVTADHVSGGRVELGIGGGWNEPEHTAYGFPFPPLDARMELVAEQTEIVYRQWTEESFDFSGKHYKLERCPGLPKPLQRPHPPLLIGGKAGRGTLGPAVRFADEYNTTFATTDELRARRRRLVAACEREGRDPATLRFSLMTMCVVGTDDAEVEERARQVFGRRSEGFADWLARQRSTGIVGTVDEVASKLDELAGAGIERVMMQHLAHEDVAMVELIGREVVPAVAD
jgi:F420-dependent oxidoreductase-like protein